MTGKVIQGSFLTGQPRWSSSVQPKVPPSSFQAKTVAPPPTVFGPRPSQSPAPARAAQPTALQRRGAGGAFAVEAGKLGIASSGGQPLPDAVRGKMEAALGADFSGVRVHVGPQAERIGAIAFTTGNDIYFAPGRYQPDTIQGQQLLGHELAHVVQQRAGRVRNPLGSGLAVVQDRALEAEADRLGQRAATHRVAAQAKLGPGPVQPSAPVRISLPVSTGSPGSYRLSAGAGGREIGSVMVHARERGAVEVTDLGVDAAQRGNGVGQMLVAAAARTGLQSGRSKVTLAAQDRGSGHLTRWYKEMGFTQTGVNRHGYPQLEAPISRVLAGTAQAKMRSGTAPPTTSVRISSPISALAAPGGRTRPAPATTKSGVGGIQPWPAPLVAEPIVSAPVARARGGGAGGATWARGAVVQRMDIDEQTDDEEDLEEQTWTHFTERPKMHTIYSYALARGGNPKVNEGPHTVANVAYRTMFEDVVENKDWETLESMYDHLPSPVGLNTLITSTEQVSTENNEKLALYYKRYGELHGALSDFTGARSKPIRDIALNVWELANLHPYASSGWKTALRGGKQVAKSSSAGKTEREGIRRRTTKGGVLSVQHGVYLYDRPSASSFADTAGFNEFISKKFEVLYKSKKKAARLIGYLADQKNRKNELKKKREAKRQKILKEKRGR